MLDRQRIRPIFAQKYFATQIAEARREFWDALTIDDIVARDAKLRELVLKYFGEQS